MWNLNSLINQSSFFTKIRVERKNLKLFKVTIEILSFGTDRSQQTMQIWIWLLMKKQSDQGLHFFAIPSASLGQYNL